MAGVGAAAAEAVVVATEASAAEALVVAAEASAAKALGVPAEASAAKALGVPAVSDAEALANAAEVSAAGATLGIAAEVSDAGAALVIAAEASELVAAGGAAAVGLASGVVAEDLVAPSKGSSVSVSSAGVESLAPPPESLSRTGVAMGSPVSSCALRSSSGSMSSVAPGALDVTGVPAGATFWSEAASCAGCVGPLAGPPTDVVGAIPRSISGSINSSPAVPGAVAAGEWRSCVWAELSRAGRTGRPGSRGSSIGRSVRGSSIKRDAGSTGSCLVAAILQRQGDSTYLMAHRSRYRTRAA
jgi:hypothetical protein